MKSVLLTALCAIAFHANAQTYAIGMAYEHDEASSNRSGLKSISKAGVLGGFRTDYGQFDANLFEVKVRGERFYDAQPGVEIGYGNGFQAGPVNISGRIGLGKVYNRGLGASSSTGTYSTYAATVGIPITPRFGVSLTARYRPEHDFDQQQQYTLGASYAITKTIMVIGGYRHTRSANLPNLNGASVQLRYYF